MRGRGVALAVRRARPRGIPLSAICFFRSRTAATTASPVMDVVRLPDSPTEYGQVSVSPQTTLTFESGTPSSSAAMMFIVVLAPGPTSVTPTYNVYCCFASTVMTALLDPTPDRNDMKATPAPRLIGPGSEPGTGFQRAFQSKSAAPRAMHASSD